MTNSSLGNDCSVSTEEDNILLPDDIQINRVCAPDSEIISNGDTEAQLQLASEFSQTDSLKTTASTNENDQAPNGSSIKKVYRPVLIDKITYDDRISLRKDFIKVKMPEIEFNPTLVFSNLHDPNLVYLLMTGCQCLLEEFKKICSGYSIPFTSSDYQIELRRIDGYSFNFKLFLRVDPDLWHKLHITDEDIELQVYDYVTFVHKECFQYEDSSTTSSQQQTSRCSTSVVCERENQCGFYTCNQHTIYTGEVWYAAARCSEYPIVTINPRKHYNNEEWVQTREAWEIFCDVLYKLKNDLPLKELPFQRVYINFGTWQSQVKVNELDPNQCHAHINMVLTAEVINLSQKGPEHLRILQYSTKSPIDHRLKDANALERTVNDGDSSGKEADIYIDSDDGPDDGTDDKIIDAIEKFLGI